MITGESQFQMCGCIPRMQTADPLGWKQTIDPLDQWDCVVVWECRSSTGLPPSKGSGPYGILVVCRINLWPGVRMEPGQEGWLKQLVAKVRGPIVAGEQKSCQGHQCSETMLTQYPCSSSVGASRDAICWPPRREANGWPTRSVRLCSGVRMQELHKFTVKLNQQVLSFLTSESLNFLNSSEDSEL
jgi:hypothetical protein